MARNFNFYSAHCSNGQKWWLEISILQCTLLSLAKMMTKNFNSVHCEIEILVVILAYLSSVQCKIGQTHYTGLYLNWDMCSDICKIDE